MTTREEDEILRSIRTNNNMRGFALCYGVLLAAGFASLIVYGVMHKSFLDHPLIAELI
jgi:hypothetical protein